MAKPQLIIIPGLGDRGRLYRAFVPVWRLLGYQVDIFVFGWEDRTLDFATSLNRLLDYIDSSDMSKQYIIGVSAGGTAAIHALIARPERIKRVVTVCTPYQPVRGLGNQLLVTSIDKLVTIPSNLKSRITSTRAIHDRTVPVVTSQPKEIRQLTLLSIGHGLTIGLALTIYSPILSSLLHTKNKR